jgi:pyruvate kinase
VVRRTKIVGTIGPASADPAVLARLFSAGLNIARVTLAHGTVESQLALVETIRRAADRHHAPVGILIDLPGPKIRTSPFDGTVEIARGDRVTLVSGDDEPSTSARFVVDYPTLVQDLEAGDLIALGDGAVQLTVHDKTAGAVHAQVIHGGRLSGRKGVKVPTNRFHGSVPTDADRRLLEAFKDAPVDIVAVSFVRSAADVRAVRDVVGPDGPWLMAKIETAPAVQQLTDIVHASDAVMVARGDLGTDLPIEDVPHLQKQIIRETVRNGKPVLVATQMLESMVQAPSPTRAEATDVANAVLDQTSAVMLSAETAIGHDPVLVIETMDRMLRRAELELNPALLHAFAIQDRRLTDINVATAHAAWQAAGDLHAAAILCCTRTGATARKMASFRPLAPLYGLTGDPRALRQLALCWGVQPLFMPHTGSSTEQVMLSAIAIAKAAGAVGRGDVVVILAGSPQAGPGHTDSVRVAVVD